IECQPSANVLPDVHIARHLVFMLVDQIPARAGLLSADIFVPCLAAVTEPVEAPCDSVPFEEPGTLVQRDAHHIVKRMKAIVFGFLTGRGCVAVVYPVVAPVVEETQRTGGLPVS